MLYALTVVAAGLLIGADDSPKGDPLAGKWSIVSVTNGGNDDPQLKGGTATFADGKLAFKTRDGMEHTGIYRLDERAKPTTIDVVPNDGPHKGITLKGIFAIEDGTLQICTGREGEDR